MRGISISASNNPLNLKTQITSHSITTTRTIATVSYQFIHQNRSSKSNPFTSLSLRSSNPQIEPIPEKPSKNNPPLVVVGSANADIYVEIERLPKEGETISARTGQTLAGGKGANQAACGGKLSYSTFFVGQIGEDAHGKLVTYALENGGVRLDYVNYVASSPTGHAVVMLQSGGQNSIIIVGGANMSGWPETLPEKHLEVVRTAGIVLLQREIPDFVNLQIAKRTSNGDHGYPDRISYGKWQTLLWGRFRAGTPASPSPCKKAHRINFVQALRQALFTGAVISDGDVT